MKQIILDLTQPKISLTIDEDCQILGLFIGHRSEQINTEIEIVHAKPGLKSETLIRTVLYDDAKVNLVCNLIIKKRAVKTEGFFQINALLLSDQASAVLTPSLEIMENDVKAGHGMTVGRVNQDQINYLHSRGLNKIEAESLIVRGFIMYIIDMIKDDKIKQQYLNLINNV